MTLNHRHLKQAAERLGMEEDHLEAVLTPIAENMVEERIETVTIRRSGTDISVHINEESTGTEE